MSSTPSLSLRTFRYRLRPDAGQLILLEEHLNLTRQLYNAALEQRRTAWTQRKLSITRSMQEKALPHLIREEPRFASIYSHVLQDVVKRLDLAFQSFFRRVKQGETPGFPRFKGRDTWDSFRFKECTSRTETGWKWTSAGRVSDDGKRANIPKIGQVAVILHRPLLGRPKTLTVKREGSEWYAIFTCEVEVYPLAPSDQTIGLDVGTRSLITTSRGEHVKNPGWLKKALKKVVRHSQTLARRKKGSNRRRKAKALLAKTHRKVSRQRLDQAHKLSNAIVKEFGTIVHEDIKPSKMVGQSSSLARSILDAGWTTFLGILSVKAESAGRTVLKVDPAYTSQRCYSCGHVEKGNRSGEQFSCRACGYMDHADVNAAKNILLKGISPGLYVERFTARDVPSASDPASPAGQTGQEPRSPRLQA